MLAGLGYSFGGLRAESGDRYAAAAKDVVPAIFKTQVLRQFIPTLIKFGPPWFRRFLVNITPLPALHELKRVVDIMSEEAVQIYQQKKRALALGDQDAVAQIGDSHDILSALSKCYRTYMRNLRSYLRSASQHICI
jgi:hypothetical protein